MKRKVVKHGTATLTISLPVQWVKKFNIQAGHELDVEESGNKIIVKPYDEKSEKEIIIEINQKENIPKRLVLSYYINGYNKIKIKYKYPEVKVYVEMLVRDYLMGFEIVEQGDNYYILKNVAKGLEEEFDVMLNRLIIIGISMLKDVYTAFSKQDLSIIKNSSTSEVAGNKINLFCRRMLNLIGHKHRIVTGLYSMTRSFEEVTDAADELSIYAVEHNVKINDECLHFVKDVLSFLELSHKMYHTPTAEDTIKFRITEGELRKKGISLIETSSPRQRIIVYYLMHIVENLHNFSEEIIA